MPTRPVKVFLAGCAVLAAVLAAWLMSGVGLGIPTPKEPVPVDAPSPATGADSNSPKPIPPAAAPFAVPTPAIDFDALEDPDSPQAWPDQALSALTVTVLDGADGPVGGVPVCVFGASHESPPLAQPRLTDREGRAKFPVDVVLEREPEIVVAARARPGGAVFVPTSVALGKATEVAIKVDAGVYAHVNLREPEGAPYDGPARVRRVMVEEPVLEAGPRARAFDEAFRELAPRGVRRDGGFLIAGFAAGEEATLVATAPGFEPSFTVVRVPEGARGTIPFELRLGRRFAVVAFEAAPPAGLGEGATSYAARLMVGGDVLVASGADDAPTQGTPRFRREVPPRSRARIRVDAFQSGAPVAAAEFDAPELEPGATIDLGTVRLDLLSIVLSGRATDADGRPIAGVKVEALPLGEGKELSAVTDATGAFALRGLKGRGPYQLAGYLSGRVSTAAERVDEGTKDLRLLMELAGAVDGRVLLPEGVDARPIRVRAVRPGGVPKATTLRPDGTFRIDDLGEGSYVLLIDGPGIEAMRVVDVHVAAPETNSEERLRAIAPEPTRRRSP